MSVMARIIMGYDITCFSEATKCHMLFANADASYKTQLEQLYKESGLVHYEQATRQKEANCLIL